jgi:hypothetical protein
MTERRKERTVDRRSSGYLINRDAAGASQFGRREVGADGQESRTGLWSTRSKSMSTVKWSESVTRAAPERLCWIANYLDVAEKAMSVIACVQGLDFPSDLHRDAQRDLRRWARWLEVRPVIAAGFAVARVVPGPDDVIANGRTEGLT